MFCLWVLKGHIRPDKVKKTKKNPMKDQKLHNFHLMPRNMVSAYHYISRAPGRLYHKKGNSYPYVMFSGVCVLIDHVSGYRIINHQVALNDAETVKAKLTF